jgi:cobalt-zinc-cadmium efflux system protein
MNHHHPIHSNQKVLLWAALVCILFAGVEAVGGLWAGSLALLSDAAHMTSDCFALTLSAAAAWLAKKPAGKNHTYGYERAEVIGAWFSSFLVLIMAIILAIEAIHRFKAPPQVSGLPVMVIATIGLAINIIIAWVLTHGHDSLNKRAAMLHVMGDLLGSVAALISGAIIHFTHWYPIDPILSILICILIALSSLRLFKEALHILMESTPKHLSLQDIHDTMTAIAHVDAIHDLHVWTLSSGNIMLSAHVDLPQINTWPNTLDNLRHALAQQFNIHHITLQPELTDKNSPCPHEKAHHPSH